MAALAARFVSVDVRVSCPAPRAWRRRATESRAHADPAGLDGFDLFGSDAFGPPSTSRPKSGSHRAKVAGGKESRPGTSRPSAGDRSSARRVVRGDGRVSRGDRKARTTERPMRRRSANELVRDAASFPEIADASCPAIDAAVVVEGSNDARAVRAAVRPKRGILLLKGSYDTKSGHHVVPEDVIKSISRLTDAGAQVFVLTDSDVTGRQLRSRIVLSVPSAKHAFLGTHESSASEETKWHGVGNVGVEHATPESVRRALNGARRAHCDGGSSGASRDVFRRIDLERWGLCGPSSAPGGSMGASTNRTDPKWLKFGGVSSRRRLVGEYLGVGDCDAKQLLRQLNLFFEPEEVEAAVASLPEEGAAIPRKMTDGGCRSDDGDGDIDIFAYVPPGQAPPGFS